MDSSRAQAFQGGGREGSLFTSIPNSHILPGNYVTRKKKKKKIKSAPHGQRNWFLLFCLSCSPPIAFYHPAALAAPIPSSHYRNVNKIGAGNVAVWWKSARSMGSSHEKNSATAQISVSIIMSPIYSENELIVEWCLVIHTMPQLDGLLPRGPAIE